MMRDMSGTTRWHSVCRAAPAPHRASHARTAHCMPDSDEGELLQDKGARSANADNVRDRQSEAEAPNQKWVVDFTDSWTAEG